MPDKIETRIAQVITYLFHPLLLTAYALGLLLNMQIYFSMAIPVKARWMIAGLVFILTVVLPILMMIFMFRMGIIKSKKMQTRQERIWPYIITAVFYLTAYFLLRPLEISFVYSVFLLGAFITVLGVLIISLFWKISAHMMAIGGLTGAFVSLSSQFMIDIPLIIMGLILLSGLIGFARLKLQAHTLTQVAAGYVFGFTVYILIFLK